MHTKKHMHSNHFTTNTPSHNDPRIHTHHIHPRACTYLETLRSGISQHFSGPFRPLVFKKNDSRIFFFRARYVFSNYVLNIDMSQHFQGPFEILIWTFGGLHKIWRAIFWRACLISTPACKLILIKFLLIDTLACDQSTPLGMKDGTIADSQITASSNYRNYGPWRGRLGNTRSWATKTENASSPWIQVKFLNVVVITGVQTQGGYYWNQKTYYENWVETLHVQYEDYPDWRYIMDGEKEMVCVSLSEWLLEVALN